MGRKDRTSIFQNGKVVRGDDKRKEVNQFSFGWTLRTIGHNVLPWFIKPPKTKRANDYKSQFLKTNKGLFNKSLYLCSYCFKPIRDVDLLGNKIPPFKFYGLRFRVPFRRKPLRFGFSVKTRKMYVDHIVPVNKGGTNMRYNLTPACFKCNQKKKDKTGIWVVRGVIGKMIYTPFQAISNLYTGIFWSKNPIRKVLSMTAWILTISSIANPVIGKAILQVIGKILLGGLEKIIMLI